eukprot:3903992-Rhodomonas_salina.3
MSKYRAAVSHAKYRAAYPNTLASVPSSRARYTSPSGLTWSTEAFHRLCAANVSSSPYATSVPGTAYLARRQVAKGTGHERRLSVHEE